MGKQLFSFAATTAERVRLHRLLRQATRQAPGAQVRLNFYFAKLCRRYGQLDPERCEIALVAGYVFVHEWADEPPALFPTL